MLAKPKLGYDFTWTAPDILGSSYLPILSWNRFELEPFFSSPDRGDYLMTPEKPKDYRKKSPMTPPMYTYPWSPDEKYQYPPFSSPALSGVDEYSEQLIDQNLSPTSGIHNFYDGSNEVGIGHGVFYPWNLYENSSEDMFKPEKCDLWLSPVRRVSHDR